MPATMKTQRQSPRLALRLSAVEATRWCRLGFQIEDDSQDQRGAKQISQIDYAADCAGSLGLTCMKCDKRVSVAEHHHNLSPFSLHIVWLKYQLRLGMLFYILSRLGSICWGLACNSNILSQLGTVSRICEGLVCFSILSRLGSICPGLALYFISDHALAVSAKGPVSKNPSYKSSSWDLKNNPGLQKPRLQEPELWKLKLNKQRHVDVLEWEIPCDHAEEVVDFASGRPQAGDALLHSGQFCKNILANFFAKWYSLFSANRY